MFSYPPSQFGRLEDLLKARNIFANLEDLLTRRRKLSNIPLNISDHLRCVVEAPVNISARVLKTLVHSIHDITQVLIDDILVINKLRDVLVEAFFRLPSQLFHLLLHQSPHGLGGLILPHFLKRLSPTVIHEEKEDHSDKDDEAYDEIKTFHVLLPDW